MIEQRQFKIGFDLEPNSVCRPRPRRYEIVTAA
jgi:hypothetical protein